MFVDSENVTVRLKLIEERMGYMENLSTLQDKRINELNKQLDHIIRQFQDLNLDRYYEGVSLKVDRFEKNLLNLQRELT